MSKNLSKNEEKRIRAKVAERDKKRAEEEVTGKPLARISLDLMPTGRVVVSAPPGLPLYTIVDMCLKAGLYVNSTMVKEMIEQEKGAKLLVPDQKVVSIIDKLRT